MKYITEILKKISKESKIAIAIILFTIFTILLISILNIPLTGFVINDYEKLDYTNSIKETYYEYSEIILDTKTIENNITENYSIKSINSIKINGIINGSASIYITDGKKTYLVASSNSKKEKGLDLITGQTIDELDSEKEAVKIEEIIETPEISKFEEIEEKIANEVAIENQTSNISEIIENNTEIIMENTEKTTNKNETNNSYIDENYTYENLMPTITELVSECRDSCNINLDKNATLILGVESGYIYIYSIEIEYNLEKIKTNLEENNYTENSTNITKKLLAQTIDEQSKNIVSQKLSKVNVDKVLKNEYEFEETFNVHIEDKKNKKNTLILNELKDIAQIENIQFISKKQHKQKEITTDIIYVNNVNITNATISLYSENPIDAIAVCDDYDPIKDSCSSWNITSIPFIYENGVIIFTVEHFTGYGGIVFSNQTFLTSSASFNDAPAFISLASGRDGTFNFINRTATSITATNSLLTMLNASIYPITGRVIRSSDTVNFSIFWQLGAQAAGNATYKLFLNNSGVTSLICQNGNDDATGKVVAASTNGLINGGCKPSSDILIPNGSGLILSVNFWVITAGNPSSGRWARIWWDNTSFNSFLNYTYIISTDINVSTNQSIYLGSQNVNATGYFYWVNTSLATNSNVSVKFFNSTKIMVYERNLTTNSNGFYSVNYTLPSNVPNEIWSVNVTGIYNSTINATNQTTFSTINPAVSSCFNITNSGYYYLTQSINTTTDCFNILTPNVFLDCSGYNITGNFTIEKNGVHTNSTNTTITNCIISNFYYGVTFNNTNNGTISNTNFTPLSDGSNAIYILSSNNTLINNNTINTRTSGSSMINTKFIYLFDFRNSINITSNRVYGNTTGNETLSALYSSSSSSLDLINIKFNYFEHNQRYGQIISLGNSTNVDISSNNFMIGNLTTAIIISNGQNILIKNNNFTGDMYDNKAISLQTLDYAIGNRTIEGNSLVNVAHLFAYELSSGSNDTIIKNNILNNDRNVYSPENTLPSPIYILRTNNVIILNNTFNLGIYPGYGIYLDFPSRINITNNTINVSNSSYAHIMIINSTSISRIYYNNFTGSGYWINNTGTLNYYNTSVGGKAQGNYYANITSYAILDTDNDGWGDNGSSYPINRSTFSTRWIGNGTDFGPATTKTIGSFCTNITSSGITNITANLQIDNYNCMEILVPNVLLDCKGYSITGNNATDKAAIFSNSTNTTVQNCTITKFIYGIQLNNSNGTIRFNNISLTNDSSIGVRLPVSGSNTTLIYNNNISVLNNSRVLSLVSNSNLFENNSLNINGINSYGIYLSGSSNTLSKNYITLNGTNSNAILLTSSNNIISNNNITSTYASTVMLLDGNNNSILLNNIFETNGTDYGIYVSAGSNTTINYNNITSYSIPVLWVNTNGNISYNNIISLQTINSPAIVLDVTGNNKLFSNNIIIGHGTTPIGISLRANASNNIFFNNKIEVNSTTYTHIQSVDSSNNTFYQNNLTGTGRFVQDLNSSNNYNTTINGKPVGNYYRNTSSYSVYDTDGNGFADSGNQYPFNQTSLGSGVWNGNGTDFGPAYARTITTISSRISPINGTTSQNLIGYCNGTESTSVNVSYIYTWYNNSITFSTGTTTSNYTSGLEVNVANLSSSNLIVNHNWTLGCIATTNGVNATRINSSNTTISPVSCYNITSSGILNLDNNVYINSSNCFNVYTSNVLIDCNGYSIIGNDTLDTYGIYTNSTNTSIIDCSVNNFNNGIYFDAGAHNGYVNNVSILINSSNSVGLFVLSSNSTIINMVNINSTSVSTPVAIYLDNSKSVIINMSKFSVFGSSAIDAEIINSLNFSLSFSNFTGGGSSNIFINTSSTGYMYNNTFNTNNSALTSLSISLSNNITIYHNNFTGIGRWANVSASNNTNFNNTISGVAQGNYYVNVTSYYVADSNSDGWADIGSQYPFNSSTVSSTWSGQGFDFAPATSYQLITLSSRITPINQTTADTILGYCNGTDSRSLNVSYAYTWYLNGVINYTSVTSSNYTSDTEINVANISSSLLVEGQTWMLGCRASTTGINSTEINSSNSTITGTICSTFNTSGTRIMTGNLQVNDSHCFDVRAANVVIDCAGYSITGNNTTDKAAIFSNSSNTTVQNCTITNFIYGIQLNRSKGIIRYNNISLTNDSSIGVRLPLAGSNTTSIYNNNISVLNNSKSIISASSNNSIYNNSLNSNGTNSYSLQVNSYSISIFNNNIVALGLNALGIRLDSANANYIYNNSIFVNGSSAINIYILTVSSNNSIYSNTLFGSGSTGIRLDTSTSNNIIYNNSISNYLSSSNSIFIYAFSNNNIFYNNSFNISSTGYHIYSSSSLNNTFYQNNFTGTGRFVQDLNSSNNYNTTINSKPVGNYYRNTTSYRVYDTDGNGYADSGNQYPFNTTTLGSNVWNGNGTDFGPATSRTITTIGARIYPVNGTASQDLIGYCNGTESASVNVSYIYTWYNNSIAFLTGITSNNYTSGLEVNVANLSSTNLIGNHNWTLGCIATTNGANATEINSSATRIQSEANSAPTISNIVPISSVDPLEESDRVLQFNFTVIDLEGNSTINISSSRTYVNYSSYTRSSSECSGFAINNTAVNISCNISVKYYDPSGVWSINVSIEDTSDAYTQDTTTTFTYNLLTAVSINSNILDFGNVSSGQENLTTSPITIRNTGNANFSFVRIKGYDLENNSNIIGAGNFSINFTNISSGYTLSNDTFINITNTTLRVSNDTYNSTINLYIYADVPIGIPALKYNSITSWIANLIS